VMGENCPSIDGVKQVLARQFQTAFEWQI